MTSIKKILLVGLMSAYALTPVLGQTTNEQPLNEDSKPNITSSAYVLEEKLLEDSKPNVSAFMNSRVGNGYFFMIGPKSGDGPASNFTSQTSFGTTIDNYTLGTWLAFDREGQIHEIDVFASRSLGEKEVKIGNRAVTLAGEGQVMALIYPSGSPAGDATDFLLGLNLNASTTLMKDLETSLNFNYLHNVVKDDVQRGGALIIDLSQDLFKYGSLNLSGTLNKAIGTGLYNFSGDLLTRFGANASVSVSDNVSLDINYNYQVTGKSQDKEVIPTAHIVSAGVNISF